MNIITKLFLATASDIPFKKAWVRLQHMDHGHPFDESIKLDSFKTENHPLNTTTHIYTINMRHCGSCGLVWFDNGFEERGRS